MQRIQREQARKYAFDWRDEPLLRVEREESFEIETWDAGTGYFRSEENRAVPALRPGFDRTPPLANPIGSPDFRINVYQMCRLGKLNYVAGAEIPRRYLAGST